MPLDILEDVTEKRTWIKTCYEEYDILQIQVKGKIQFIDRESTAA